MVDQEWDVILIGAGQNNFALGTYLGMAGLKTVICESRLENGGRLASEEITMPGYWHKPEATAESVTGGLIASRLTDIPGSSEVFRGAVVSYASAVKYDVLGVPEGQVVSAEAAEAVAEGACRVLGADVALAVTGVAGPGEQEGMPVGTVFLAIAEGAQAQSVMVRLPGDRARVRQFATISVLDLLRRSLLAG